MTTFLDFARRGRTEAWRYPLAIVLSLVLWAAVTMAAAVGLKLAGWLPAELTEQMTHLTNPIPYFTATGAVFALLLAGFVGGLALVHRKRFADVVGDWRWGGFVLGAGLWSIGLVALTAIDFALAPHGFSLSPRTPSLALLACILPALAVQTFTEEFLFRGYLTQALLLALRRPAVTAIVSGLLFGAIHIPNGWPQAANAAVFGVVLALIAIRTRSLAFGAGLHLVNNLFGAVVVVSSSDVFSGSPGLFVQSTPQLAWWDMGTATVAMALVVAWVMMRKPAVVVVGESGSAPAV